MALQLETVFQNGSIETFPSVGGSMESLTDLLSTDGRSSALITGDSATVLGELPSGLFQTCITSPPYWSLRDYDIKGQIGLEDSLDEYLLRLTEIFRQVWRTLRADGTLWLNIGDSYTSGGRKWRAPDKKNPVRAMSTRPPTPEGLKPKDLIGVPWLLAFALQRAGWFLRADIIWYKPNPESTEGGRRVSVLKRQEDAPANLG